MKTARRLDNLGTETAFRVAQAAADWKAQGNEVFPFHLGDLNFPLAGHIVEAVEKAIADGKTGYCPGPGIPELREALADDIGSRRGMKIDPAEVDDVVIGAAPLSLLDDRSYRDAQLTAGLVEGRLHLAAYALGASATGMTFLDSEVPALLGEPDDLATLLFTCVGVPEYASRSGGGPGAPVEIRPVAERFKDE